jgi:hypothetical protein
MRRWRNAPLVKLPVGAKCYDGIISVVGADLFHQKLTPGTTAGRKSYRRR